MIPKAEVNPAMLKALLADEWPIWSAKTGGWPNLNHEYEYVYPLKVRTRSTCLPWAVAAAMRTLVEISMVTA